MVPVQRESCKNFISTQVYSLSHNELIGLAGKWKGRVESGGVHNGKISSINVSSPTIALLYIRETAGIFRTERFFIIHSLLGDHIETRFYIKIIFYVFTSTVSSRASTCRMVVVTDALSCVHLPSVTSNDP